jgi:acyl dehydratase
MGIEELRNRIGVELQLGTYEIEKGMIRKFAQAVDDPNPLWQSEEYASKSNYRGIVAPPTFTIAIGFELFQEQALGPLFLEETVVNGGTELEQFQPIRPGDVISVSTKIANVYEHEGKKGKRRYVNFETSYHNQRSELVARWRTIAISY